METMKIKRGNTNSSIDIKSKGIKDFQQLGSRFEQSFKYKTKKELQEYINEIKKRGNRLAITQNYNDVLSYKKTIKNYLQTVVDSAYCLNKNTNFWENQYYTIVEKINDNLENLTQHILEEEKEYIDIASTIDNIQGLLLDIYK